MVEGLPNLGPVMSLEDATYAKSAASLAGFSSPGPACECPGFDSELMASPEALLGRWVRSPKKFVGWDTYMEFFGLEGEKALQETEEPQEHVILSFSKREFRLVHRLPWRDGLDCEYTVPIDGSKQPIPPAMVARASSSWKVNDLASWVHAWDEGDGNPLHRGLRTEQKLKIGEVHYTLRYWRSLIRPDEMRVNVEVTYSDTGKYAVHTQRFFRKIDIERAYAIACLPSAVTNLQDIATWTCGGRGVRVVILPHASNMRPGWKDLTKVEQWEQAEPFPSAGRSSGPYLSSLRIAAREAALWICCGVVLQSKTEAESRQLLRGVALIGADGWLHAVHTDAALPVLDPYSAGSGDWPATQKARPHGVYDTELGRMALCVAPPDSGLVRELVSMGAELILAPPKEDESMRASRVAVSVPAIAEHSNLTRYEVCGPEPLPLKIEPGACWRPVVVAEDEQGKLQADAREVKCAV